MRRPALAALVALAAARPAPAAAQEPALRRVAGTVVNATDSVPVAGASVAIIGTTLRMTTDAGGRFAFPRAPVDMLDLLAARIGYEPEILSLPSGPGDDTAVVIVLPPNPVEISPVVVTASREAHLADETPVSVAIATATDLEQHATIGLDEAIARVPGVEIQDGQIGIRGSSGYAKGLGSRVLLLVDGVPVNEADRDGIDWDLLPASEVERVEVVKGTASALYGSDALGGVVNVLTREIPDSLDLRVSLVAGAYAAPPYEVWRWRTTPALFGGADVGVSRRLGPVKLLLAGGGLRNDGYRQNNEDRRAHGLAKLVLVSSPALQAELVAAAADERYGQVLQWCVRGQCADSGQDYQPFRVDSTTLGNQTRSTKYLVQAAARQTLTADLALRGRVSWYRTSFDDAYRTGSDHSTSDRLGGELGAEWHPREGRVIDAGTEGTYATVTSDLFGDHSQTELAWYAEDESSFGETGRLTLGARVDAIAVDGVAWNAVASPRLAVTWAWWPVRLRASVGRGFRAPSLAERFTSTAAQGIQVIPNPNLQDETSWSGEVGATAPAGRHLALDAALFWSEYQDLIEPELVTGGTQIQFTNVTRARVRGLDLAARAADLVHGHLSASLAWTWLDARDLTADQPLAFRPRDLATLSADWRSALGGAGTVTLGVDARLIARPERVEIYEDDRRVAARTLDLRVAWRRGGVTTIAKVENALNYIYTLVPRTLEPPRTYSLTVAVDE